MAYFINDECMSCGACVFECEKGCIEEGDGKYIIDAEKCDECGACVESCSFEAIVKE